MEVIKVGTVTSKTKLTDEELKKLKKDFDKQFLGKNVALILSAS